VDPRRIPLVRPDLPPLEAYGELLEEIWEARMLSNFAHFARRLESLAASSMGHPHVAAVANCDVGLTLAVAALDLPAGSEAILPAFGWPSIASAARWNGLRLRFVDVEPHTYGVDPQAVADAITPDTSLIVATHVFGAPCEIAALAALAEERGVRLIADGAAAIGTFVDDRHVAAFGDATVFSLSGTKLVTSAEGGLAAFRDPVAAERFRQLRSYGAGGLNLVAAHVGLNGKLSELHAALGCLTLARLDESLAERARLVDRYRTGLGDRVGFQATGPNARSTHTFLALDTGLKRDKVRAHLSANDVESKTYFTPLDRMPAFAPQERRPLPETERLAASLLCVPLYVGLTDDDVDRVCGLIGAALDA
jgi:dTDP-4-amino-4,6-dideoxygalactose transaminase